MSTSHNTKATFAKWAPIARGAQLAAIAIEAAKLHRDGRMTAQMYRQRIEGLASEVQAAGVEKEYREALVKQAEQEQAEKPEATPEQIGEGIRQLEALYREAEQEFKEAERYHLATAQEALLADEEHAEAQLELIKAKLKLQNAEVLLVKLSRRAAK